MQRLTDQLFRGFGGEERGRIFAPPVDIYEENEAIVVKAELPGVSAQDVEVNVDNDVLTIRGERKSESEEHRGGVLRMESVYGSFTRSFALPESVDAEKVEADLSDGVLTVRIPKKPEIAPKRVEVRAKGEQKKMTGGGIGKEQTTAQTEGIGEQSKQDVKVTGQPQQAQQSQETERGNIDLGDVGSEIGKSEPANVPGYEGQKK
jgi:HSP20 family protein